MLLKKRVGSTPYWVKRTGRYGKDLYTAVQLFKLENMLIIVLKSLVFVTNTSFLIPISLQPLIFQTQIFCSNIIHSLKYLRSATLECKDINYKIRVCGKDPIPLPFHILP